MGGVGSRLASSSPFRSEPGAGPPFLQVEPSLMDSAYSSANRRVIGIARGVTAISSRVPPDQNALKIISHRGLFATRNYLPGCLPPCADRKSAFLGACGARRRHRPTAGDANRPISSVATGGSLRTTPTGLWCCGWRAGSPTARPSTWRTGVRPCCSMSQTRGVSPDRWEERGKGGDAVRTALAGNSNAGPCALARGRATARRG